jgi:hypothetical protein
MTWRRAVLVACLASLGSYRLLAQVSTERLMNAVQDPKNWLIYSGNYSSTRHSQLAQITPANVKNLELKWMYQGAATGAWQTTPLVVDGIMYLTQRPNEVVALDAKTGRVFWIYRYTLSPTLIVCCGANNRGLAMLGDTLFMGTLDAHLVAIDAKSGRPLWKTQVAEAKGRIFAHARAARGQGQGDRRRRRRGVRDPRIRRGVRCEERQGSVALLHDPRTRRSGLRELGPLSPRLQIVLRPGGVEARRRIDLGDRLVRSRVEPDLLGRRQRRARLERGSAAGRQPLHRLGRCARRRQRPPALALPVHAARSLRLRLGAGADPG